MPLFRSPWCVFWIRQWSASWWGPAKTLASAYLFGGESDKPRGYTPPRRTSWGTCQYSSADICPFAEAQYKKTDKLRVGTCQDVALKRQWNWTEIPSG